MGSMIQKLLFTSLLYFLTFSTFSQTTVLLLGNSDKICTRENSTIRFEYNNILPDSISKFSAIMIFSGANSALKLSDLDRLAHYVKNGNGLYIGCENWPLQAESNQLTNYFFQKEFWGNNTMVVAESTKNEKGLIESEYLNAGQSTVQFPMDSRLKVEAWVNDEPLILSTEYFGGQLLLDGGYSRFYCLDQKEKNAIWESLLEYLLKN